MGITIYYCGRLHSMEQLPCLVEEVIHLSGRAGWENEIIYRSHEIPLQGIAFAPKGSEPVWLTFLDDGDLVNPNDYEMITKGSDELMKKYRAETKTHYTGATNHIRIIKLIKYLGAKYFSEFGMYDESQYWQTGNEAICRKEFEIMEKWVSQLVSRLDEMDGRIGEIGETGELVNERIHALMMRMPVEDLATYLDTPRPETEVMGSLDN